MQKPPASLAIDVYESLNSTIFTTAEGASGAAATTNMSDDNNTFTGNSCLMYDFLMEAVIAGCLCLLGFVGNTLSMMCLWHDRSKSATPFLLMSLEVADTLFLLTVLIIRVLPSTHTFTGWFESITYIFPYFGKYVYPCALTAEMGTIYLTILVTLNRYMSVCRPYDTSTFCSQRDAKKHVVIVCLISIIFNVPRFFEYDITLIYNESLNESMLGTRLAMFARTKAYQIVYQYIMYGVVMFVLPGVVLLILNYKLILVLRQTKRKRTKLLNISSKSEDDITLMLIVVVLVFIVCQAPALVTQVLLGVLQPFYQQCPHAFFYYARFSDVMVVINSSINFIIYCFCSRRFRHILIALICKTPFNASPQSSQMNTTYRPAKREHNGDTQISHV